MASVITQVTKPRLLRRPECTTTIPIKWMGWRRGYCKTTSHTQRMLGTTGSSHTCFSLLFVLWCHFHCRPLCIITHLSIHLSILTLYFFMIQQLFISQQQHTVLQERICDRSIWWTHYYYCLLFLLHKGQGRIFKMGNWLPITNNIKKKQLVGGCSSSSTKNKTYNHIFYYHHSLLPYYKLYFLHHI